MYIYPSVADRKSKYQQKSDAIPRIRESTLRQEKLVANFASSSVSRRVPGKKLHRLGEFEAHGEIA